MPLYIPWLTETIKKRGVRYLLHHYLGQFFEEKLTLEQLSIDIYEGRGSIRNLALDVDGLNDELDFIPFKFLDGCLIGQISVEVPWSSLATDACKVELDGAKFVCRLKTSADGLKAHCTESTLLTKSLMTTSMQMAEEIVTTEDDDEYDQQQLTRNQQAATGSIKDKDSNGRRRKDANQMFEGLEMFAQLIDSVLRRTKLTARDTLFQIQPYLKDDNDDNDAEDVSEAEFGIQDESSDRESTRKQCLHRVSSRSSGDEFCEPYAASDGSHDQSDSEDINEEKKDNSSQETVEFFIKFFRCEEIIDQTRVDSNGDPGIRNQDDNDDDSIKKSLNVMPETITKLLTLEDVEMRIGGIPVSNLTGKHTITIKFNGQKSEISIFSGSPLLAVISHVQLETFFNVFDNAKKDVDSRSTVDTEQKLLSQEDYAKIENQLLESASLRGVNLSDFGGFGGFNLGGGLGARRWVDGGDTYSCSSQAQQHSYRTNKQENSCPDYDYHSANSSTIGSGLINSNQTNSNHDQQQASSLDNIEAFSCELKLPGIWLCILQDGEKFPPLIKPYADSINSFQTINKYIDGHIKVPHIRCLALKVALNLTAKGINIFLGDLDISEYLESDSVLTSKLELLHNDLTNVPMNTPRYKASINNREITIDLLTKTRIIFDPTMIDRIVYDYQLVKLNIQQAQAPSNCFNNNRAHLQKVGGSRRSLATNASSNYQTKASNGNVDFNFTIRGDRFMVELLCPIPDLTPQASLKRTQLRPQSFLFDFKNINLTWQNDKLKISSNVLLAYVKTQPKQRDLEAVKFIESSGRNNDKIVLILEPSPSNLDDAFPNEVEQALNESSMYDSIYVGQTSESRIPTEPFQTKRKVVRATLQAQKTTATTTTNSAGKQADGAKLNEFDHEKILTPGDRQHLLDYLSQTLMSTKLSLDLHLPICEVEFEDKEQLDLIYNRFGNDFVFWQPKTTSQDKTIGSKKSMRCQDNQKISGHNKPRSNLASHNRQKSSNRFRSFKLPAGNNLNSDTSSIDDESKDFLNNFDGDNLVIDNNDDDADLNDYDDDASEVSYHSINHYATGSANLSSDQYENEVTCKIRVDELLIRFNHQSCAAALRQEISADNLLLGVVIDVNKKPNTLLSLVADNLELITDSARVLEGNHFGVKNSTFSLTAEIKRPIKSLKDIKLAIQLQNGLLNDFKTETYTRFWQSINVTDEPILGYVAPRIITELHIDILNTAISIQKENTRPALLTIDELYLTSMVMEQTSQVMIRLIADEVSLYLKRNRKSFELMKNYICLVDSGLIDLDVKLSQDGRLEFGVINNVITMRVCQDSLSAMCKLVNVLIRSSSQGGGNGHIAAAATNKTQEESMGTVADSRSVSDNKTDDVVKNAPLNSANARSRGIDSYNGTKSQANLDVGGNIEERKREMNLLADAMNDFNLTASSNASSNNNAKDNSKSTDKYMTACESDDERQEHYSDFEDDDQASNSSGPPMLEHQASEDDNEDDEDEDDDDDDQLLSGPLTNSSNMKQRNPTACLLDESNPLLGDLFSPPLLPMSDETRSTATTSGSVTNDHEQLLLVEAESRAMGESGFFIIGDDDIGAGIIHHTQQEPAVRKLIEGPINIVDNHFKSTKPRTIPEMLANSLERYVLEEMTLVVNLYGGRDFDDEDPSDADIVTTTTPTAAAAAATTTTTTASSTKSADLVDLDNSEKRPLFESSSSPSGEIIKSAIRSRAGSLAAPTTSSLKPTTCTNTTTTNYYHQHYQTNSGSLKSKQGSRRKHLSEGSGHGIGQPSGSSYSANNTTSRHSMALDQHRQNPMLGFEPRVRFGEGAVNLWESLDLMSSPDLLTGGRSRPRQQALNSDLKQAGGTWRQTDVCIQLTLSKVKLLYEVTDVAELAGHLGAQEALGAVAAAAVAANGAKAPSSASSSSSSSNQANTSTLGARSVNVGPQATAAGALGNQAALAPISWRFMLFIDNIEVKDRIAASDINKLLYEYCTESMPRRSTQFLTVKNTATINPCDGCEECDLRVSLKPLRLNVDQDTLLFLIEFFTGLQKSLLKQQSIYSESSGSNAAPTKTPEASSGASSASGASLARPGPGSGAKLAQSHHQQAASSSGGIKEKQFAPRGAVPPRQRHGGTACRGSSEFSAEIGSNPSSTSSSLSTATSLARANDCSSAHTIITTTTNVPGQADGGSSGAGFMGDTLPTHCHTDLGPGGSGQQQAIYIKSFTFSPDVPIRLDYHAKHLDFEQGALAGILMGLAHLDHSELVLRRVQAKHGMRGLDRVLLFAINSWLSDIKRNQLPSILRGVGPMHNVIQLFQGMRDLIWMPIDHYRKDKRLVRGLQRGASSFSSSTAMAAINLVNRFISIVQCTAQIAHDIVTPPATTSGHHRHRHHHHHHHHHHRPISSKSMLAGSSFSTSSGHHQSNLRNHSRIANARNHQYQASLGCTGASGAGVASLAGAQSHLGGAGLSQPRNFCEGVAVGFTIIKEGFNDTARNVTVGMQAEDMRSAVGELVRQIPSTLLNPIISATEGAQSVLVGIRNQIAPEARREDQEKWKRRVRGK